MEEVPEGLTERQRAIATIVMDQGFATIETLSRHFDVSAQSIRRDIIKLDADGVLQRFHGGVGVRGSAVRLDYAEKKVTAADAKQRIGQATAQLIPDGASVFLDVGTTVEAVARALKTRTALRVFTTSLQAATILTDQPGIDLFVIGGSLRGADGSLVGDQAIQAIQRFRFDYAVIGFSGFDSDGAPMDFDHDKVAVKQAAIARAAAALAVSDSSKFYRTALIRIAPMTAFSRLVTDASPSGDISRILAENGAGRLFQA